MAPHTGLKGRVELVVGAPDTAEAFRSGTVPVLATPRLVALCEEASVQAVADDLDEGTTTVAKRLQFDHLAPVGIGGTVWAEATLDRIEGRRLVFTISVSEKDGLVAAGKLTRVVVNHDAFLANVR